MPTVNENKAIWDGQYDWTHAGDEWSAQWGSAQTQWYHSILPRIHALLPAKTILEIAPGFGRWTQFLAPQCQRLILVDLSEQCIQACQERFCAYSHIEYHVNDGKSIDFITDHSIDFVFTFDSLVHVEEDIVASYLDQLSRKLTPDGVGLIHHSNFGEYAGYLSRVNRLPYRLRQQLAKRGLIETLETQWRAPSMTAAKFAAYAEKSGLQCISQEMVNWQSKRLIDCISIFTPKGSKIARENLVFRNGNFMREASYALSLSRIYDGRNR